MSIIQYCPTSSFLRAEHVDVADGFGICRLLFRSNVFLIALETDHGLATVVVPSSFL